MQDLDSKIRELFSSLDKSAKGKFLIEFEAALAAQSSTALCHQKPKEEAR